MVSIAVIAILSFSYFELQHNVLVREKKAKLKTGRNSTTDQGEVIFKIYCSFQNINSRLNCLIVIK